MTRRLISIRLRAFVGSLCGKRKDGSSKISKARLAAMSALFGFIGLMFSGFVALYAALVGMIMIPLGLEEMYLGAFMTVDFAVVFFLSIFEMKSELFECKDNELLLSMPIPPRAIVTSRISVVLILNTLESMLFLLPAVIIFGILGGSLAGIFGGILVMLLIPLLATALSAAFGCLFAIIAKKLKRLPILRLIISVLALLAFYKVYFGIFDVEDEMIGEELAEMLNNPAMYAIGLSAMLHPIATPILAVAAIGGAALAFYLISKSYISIVTANYSAKKAEYKGKVGKARSPMVSLAIKELRRYTSSTQYILNSSSGIIFACLLCVGGLIYSESVRQFAGEISLLLGGENILPALLCCAGVLCFSLNTTAASALSLEGSSLWVIKSMPISGRDVLLAKCAPQLVVCLPLAIVYGVIASIISEAGALGILIVLVLIFANVACSLLGIILNTALPKFKFDNIVQPIKQSGAVALAMLFGFVLSLLSLGIGIFLSTSLGASWALGILLAIMVTLSLCELAVVMTKCAARFDRMGA